MEKQKINFSAGWKLHITYIIKNILFSTLKFKYYNPKASNFTHIYKHLHKLK
jgi:hypothetical protein